MSNVELLNTLLAVAGLILSAYALGLQNRRQNKNRQQPNPAYGGLFGFPESIAVGNHL